MAELALRVLSIAGSDPTSGAGIQADLKTFAALGAYGVTAITALTVQDTRGIREVEVVRAGLLRSQILTVVNDIGIDAVKVGMLGNLANVEEVMDCVGELGDVPIVVDPVLCASDGSRLLSVDAERALVEGLFPAATLVTPNAAEASVLSGGPVESLDEQKEAARRLGEHGTSVLVTGGHVEELEVNDVLFANGEVRVFSHRRLSGGETHGTGCALSSALAVFLGQGSGLEKAVDQAIDFVSSGIEAGLRIGGGSALFNHFAERTLKASEYNTTHGRH